MSENAEWIIDLREQQLRDLRAQLATATQRAEVAETALSAEFVYAVDLVNRYGQEQWRRGVKGQASVEFTHWKATNE